MLLTGENVREFFFRVASVTFEANLLAELEKSSSRRIGDVVSKYRMNGLISTCYVMNKNTLHLPPSLPSVKFIFSLRETATCSIGEIHTRVEYHAVSFYQFQALLLKCTLTVHFNRNILN